VPSSSTMRTVTAIARSNTTAPAVPVAIIEFPFQKGISLFQVQTKLQIRKVWFSLK